MRHIKFKQDPRTPEQIEQDADLFLGKANRLADEHLGYDKNSDNYSDEMKAKIKEAFIVGYCLQAVENMIEEGNKKK